ncbi:MAG TPA: hypothetical protein VN903_37250 [Polyangia bacterium]|nr:hypothetical protein [Polyangia bacterium]
MLRFTRAGLHSRASLAAGLLAALATATFAAPAHARRAAKAKAKTTHARKAPRASKVTPNQDGKVALFPVRYDEDNGFSAQIERLLRAHGLNVATDVRRVDTSEQFRELSTALGFAAYVDGELNDGPSRSKLTIVVRNGYTGKKVAVAAFRETKLHIRAEVEDNLWTKIGPAIARACTDASKPRKRDRDPLMIEAGTPLADR